MPNLVTSASYDDLNRTVSMVFEQAYGESEPWWHHLATMIPSSTSVNEYLFENRILKMEEWLGPRTLQNLSNQEYSLKNKRYQAAVSVLVDQIEDDQLGVFKNQVSGLGRAAAKWPDQLLKVALQAGTVDLGFDGLPFFSATHTVGVAPALSAVQSNNFTGAALSATTYNAARSAMMSYTGEDDEPLGVTPTLLTVPPQLEQTGREIIRAGTILQNGTGSAGVTNVWQGSAELLVVSELANEPTTWYLGDTSKPLKPLIWQLRKAPVIVSKNQPTDDNVFFDDEFIWGSKGRGRIGYSPWWLMSRSIA